MGWKINGGITAAEREKLDKLDVGVKSNLTAISAPTATDDVKKGYGTGSIWIYSGTTYTCASAEENNAVWVSTTDISYFPSYASLITAISVVGSGYVGKYCQVAMANDGPDSGVTYVKGQALTNFISDGGTATYRVNVQGTNYSITCQTRQTINPILKKIYTAAEAKPTIPGYYAFCVIPTGGLPAGIALNDICRFDGTMWILHQTYASAVTALVAGATLDTQVTWRKFNGTWMSTADDYVPDGKEYQTGKLWNGKAVYRRCTSGTLQSTAGGMGLYTGINVPISGVIVLISGTARRNVAPTSRFSIGPPGTSVELLVDEPSGNVLVWINPSAATFCSQPYVAWVEYTKS